jgi:hypothetical protein
MLQAFEIFRRDKPVNPRSRRRGGVKELMKELRQVMERAGGRSRSQPLVKWEDFASKFQSSVLGLPQDLPDETGPLPDWFAEATERAAKHVLTPQEASFLGKKTKAWFSSKKNEYLIETLVEFLRKYKRGSDVDSGKYLAIGPWVIWRILSMKSWYEESKEKRPDDLWAQSWQESVTPQWIWDPRWVSEPRMRGMFRTQMMAPFHARSGLVIWPFAAREAFHLYMEYVAESKDSDTPQTLWQDKYNAKIESLISEGLADSAVIRKRLAAYRRASRLDAWISENPISDLKLFGIGQCHIAGKISEKQMEARAEVLRKRYATKDIVEQFGLQPDIQVPESRRDYKRSRFGHGRKNNSKRISEGSKPRAKPIAPPESPVVFRSPPSKVEEPRPKKDPLPELQAPAQTVERIGTVVRRRKVK